jgi:hypothetical protein
LLLYKLLLMMRRRRRMRRRMRRRRMRMGKKKMRRPCFGFEVGDCIFASVFQGGSVVGSGSLLLLVEGSEPDPLVLVVDLGPPSPVGLWHDSLEVR